MNKHLNTQNKDQKLTQFNYLIDVEGPEALAFAKKNNALSDERLKTDKRYKPTYNALLKILSSKDKLPAFYIMDNEIYNFWQDSVHVKGILRKATVKSFNSRKPEWTLILDIDLLAKTEKENWVYKGMNCLDPDYDLCIINLSRGGKDATVLREFSLRKKDFIKDGFSIPESKSSFSWVDKDTILLRDGTNTATLTTSGYPSEIKVLKRGESIATAKVIFKCSDKCMSVESYSQLVDDKRHLFVTNQISFYEAEQFYLNLPSLKLTAIPIPKTANFEGLYKGQLLFSNRDPYEGFPAGSLLSIAFTDLNAKKPKINPVFVPTETSFYENSSRSKNHLWVVTLNDVKKQVLKFNFNSGSWKSEDIVLADSEGNESISASDENSEHVYLNYSDFLTPTTIYHLSDGLKTQAQVVLKSPIHFKSKKFTISQFKVKSKDGTLIPYFVVYSKKLNFNQKNPTLLYGYGGFEIPMTSNYLGTTGKVWLEKGGVYVLSNIRGGGEYGPNWHQAALRENRHKAFDDFYAIAEDLIHRKITSAKHLGIRGGSNGGLLTSVAFTQRPELFSAVISEVPLANMLEYHHWLAGASWMEEYGDPDDAKMREYLVGYSPLHNLVKGKQYPEVFFLTSTKDDRVHPAHARQMVARLQELGYPVLYNENTDGGHGRAANMKDLAEFLALEFTYLYQKLF